MRKEDCTATMKRAENGGRASVRIRRRRRGVFALLHLGRVPLKEQGVADRQQRWTEEHADEAEAKDAADEPEEGEHHGQVAGLTQEMGPEDIVYAADEEQTPCRDEDAPPT